MRSLNTISFQDDTFSHIHACDHGHLDDVRSGKVVLDKHGKAYEKLREILMGKKLQVLRLKLRNTKISFFTGELRKDRWRKTYSQQRSVQ